MARKLVSKMLQRNADVLLRCCICAYTKTGLAEPASTILGGYAVCYDHVGYVATGMEWYAILKTVKENEQ